MISSIKTRMATEKNSVYALAGEIVPLVSSSLLFILLIALLSPERYGVFVAVTASAMIITPVARAGASIALLRDVGEGRADQVSWDDALNAVLLATGVTVLGWAAITDAFLPTAGFTASVALFTAQLIPLSISELTNSYLTVKLKMFEALSTRLVFAGWRLAAIACFALLGTDSIATLGLVLLIGSSFGALHNVIRMSRQLGVKSRIVRRPLSSMMRGLPDSFSGATGSVLDSIDRPLLLRAGFGADAGRYGVAMRLVGLAGVPIIGLLRPYDRALFEAGAISTRRATRVMVGAAKRTVPSASAAAILLFAFAFGLPSVLPADYSEAADIVKWTVWIMPLRAISFPFGNTLTASGHRALRFWITLAATIGNVVGNLLFIPTYSWRAAVGTTLAAETFMALGMAAGCFVLSRRDDRESAPDSGDTTASDGKNGEGPVTDAVLKNSTGGN